MKVYFVSVPCQLRPIVNQTVEEFWKSHGLNPRASLNVEFVNPEKIRQLNKKYRQIDETTDVLSFPLWENLKSIPEKGQVSLGDIFICPEEINLNQELPKLIKHSLNHLIGKHR
jgi:probable rRNA maturation factor